MTHQPPLPGPPAPPPPTPPYGSPQSGAAPRPSAWAATPGEERTWATVAHLGGLLGPLPALVVHLFRRHRGPFLAAQSREALNFQITMLVAYAGASVFAAVTDALLWFPVRLHAALWVVSAVFSLLAARDAHRGLNHRYRWALRIVP